MRTPIDLYENEWLPSQKSEEHMLLFIAKVQQDAFKSGFHQGAATMVASLEEAKTKKDSNAPH